MKAIIVALEPSPEPQLLRLQLEHLGAQVRLVDLGRPSELFSSLDFYGQPADLAILCGHGDEAGFILPELAEGVDPLVLPNRRLTPQILAENLVSAPPTVISTACDTGHKAFAEAFFGVGTRSYIAPVGYPDGGVVPILLGVAFYRVVYAGASWPAAFRAASMVFTLENGFAAHLAR